MGVYYMKIMNAFEELSDYELIKECLKGNNECFSELVTRYKRLVYSTVYCFEKEQEDVFDISQEVFIRVYKSLDKYNPQYKFSTWIVRITRNLCLDTLRKKKAVFVPMEECEAYCSNEQDTPEVQYIRMEKNREIKKAIEGLPEKYKIVMVLYHKMGLSYKDMSDKLNEPMSIIKNRMFKGRLLLKDRLKGIETAC